MYITVTYYIITNKYVSMLFNCILTSYVYRYSQSIQK